MNDITADLCCPCHPPLDPNELWVLSSPIQLVAFVLAELRKSLRKEGLRGACDCAEETRSVGQLITGGCIDGGSRFHIEGV